MRILHTSIYGWIIFDWMKWQYLLLILFEIIFVCTYFQSVECTAQMTFAHFPQHFSAFPFEWGIASNALLIFPFGNVFHINVAPFAENWTFFGSDLHAMGWFFFLYNNFQSIINSSAANVLELSCHSATGEVRHVIYIPHRRTTILNSKQKFF